MHGALVVGQLLAQPHDQHLGVQRGRARDELELEGGGQAEGVAQVLGPGLCGDDVSQRGRREEETWAEAALLDVMRRVERWNASLPSTPRDFIQAGRARQARLARRRRLGLGAAFATISLVALAAGLAALQFREKEREAIAQQELIRLAAGDVGRFELVLELFDWDSEKLERTPASPTALKELEWRVHSASRTSPPVMGAVLDEGKVKRSGRHVDEQGRLSEFVEMGRDPVFFEFVGRGGDCGPSYLLVQGLPGYAERRTPPAPLHMLVPTCAASREGLVRFTAPDAGTFGLGVRCASE